MTALKSDVFLWGTATAAHQVEGNNTNADAWIMEQMPDGFYKEPSGNACDHYHRYRRDIALLAELGFNSYRFSIEWARIEPEEGIFSSQEIEHYRDMLLTCQQYGLTPVVTLHHFTSPRWLISQGGWADERTPELFARYCQHVVQAMGDLLPYICTINEANIASVIKYTVELGDLKPGAPEPAAPVPVGMPATEEPTLPPALLTRFVQAALQFGVEPQNFHPFLFSISGRARQVILTAHQQAREAIKAVNPAIRVGLTLALPDLQAAEGGEERLRLVEQEVYRTYLDATAGDDFLGVQVYTRALIGPDGVLPAPAEAELTQMGYEFYPEALEGSLRRVAQHTHLPLMVTENGLATDDDTRRSEYIRRAVAGIERCLRDGLPVLGYLYWSAFDNFEWTLGFEKRFGLIGVNRQTQERTVKASARLLGKLARAWQAPTQAS